MEKMMKEEVVLEEMEKGRKKIEKEYNVREYEWRKGGEK